MKTIIIGSLFLLASLGLKAQLPNVPAFEHQGVMMGYDLTEFQSDLGLGLSVYSPSFWRNRAKIRLGGSLQWLQCIPQGKTDYIWSPYGNIRIGMQGKSAIVNQSIYIYGEGGVILLMPNSKFSSESIKQGGYGTFGFEFYVYPKLCYYIELGTVGTGAIADKAVGKPIYSNGFATAVGLRWGF